MPLPDVIEFLAELLSSPLMVAAWLIPLAYSLKTGKNRKQIFFLMLAFVCVFPLLYYMWAVTGIFRSHVSALAFNRTADLLQIVTIILIIRGMSARD